MIVSCGGGNESPSDPQKQTTLPTTVLSWSTTGGTFLDFTARFATNRSVAIVITFANFQTQSRNLWVMPENGTDSVYAAFTKLLDGSLHIEEGQPVEGDPPPVGVTRTAIELAQGGNVTGYDNVILSPELNRIYDYVQAAVPVNN